MDLLSTHIPWAKLARAEDGSIRAALPLLDHSLDVAATFEALRRGGTWDGPLARTAGRSLTARDWARLIVLVALHDLGKVNRGFAARRDPSAPRIGHTGPVAALLFDPGLRAGAAGRALLDLFTAWGAHQHFAALMAHHGKPLDEFSKASQGNPNVWSHHVAHWRPADGYDPAAEAAALIETMRARWPLAWEAGEKLPEKPAFVWLFAGLVVLADWLGSDTRRFPVEGPHGAQREPMRGAQAAQAIAVRGLAPLATPASGFEASFGFPPQGVQSEAAAGDLGPVALIEAETGSGKTEAALWRWLELRRRGEVDGLYFALPTRSAAVQLHERVGRMLERVWGKDGPEAVLAVPGYLRAGDAEGQALPGWEVRWDDGPDDSRWAAERSNRYLAARVAVGTIDQALLAALRVKHAPVRAAALARSLLVVDEVHASDAYMGGLLERLLDNHVAAGGRALLLSATLGAETRAKLLRQPVPSLAEAEAQPYPALSGREALPRAAATSSTSSKAVRIETAGLIGEPEAIAARAVAAARAGASVLVVRNLVSDAIAVTQAVEALAPEFAFRVNQVATVHHGRFAPSDRRLLDAAVEAAFGKQRSAAGRVLVGTQTLEQSLDLDADLLLTDLAPMDVLLQRIGRLHRHTRTDRGAFAEARAIVLCPAERDLSPLLEVGRAAHGLGATKDGRGVYPNVLHLEATLRLLETNPLVTIPADNRRLVERALHPEMANAIAQAFEGQWDNFKARANAIAYADRKSALELSLDLSTPFRDVMFPELRGDDEKVATRLGALDLLVDFDEGWTGPFGATVERIRIPHWMAAGAGKRDRPELLERDEEGQHFRLGERRYVYGRWGLAPAP